MAVRAWHGDEDRRTDRAGGRTAAAVDAQLLARRLAALPVGSVAAGARDLPRRLRHFLPRTPAEQADRSSTDDRRRTPPPDQPPRRPTTGRVACNMSKPPSSAAHPDPPNPPPQS